MAEQILTQVEVDALLKGLSNGDIKTEAEKHEEVLSSVRPYDFYNQEKGVRGKLLALDIIHEKLSRNLRYSAGTLLRKTIDVTHEGVKSMKFGDFLRNLQVPSSLNMFHLNPLRGQGLLVIDPNLVFLIVDSYFGGDGIFHTRIEGREFSNLEQSVIKKVVDIIFAELKEVWKTLHPVEFTFTKAEMNPHFVNIIGQTEPVVVCTFRMEIETAMNKFFLCIPFQALEPIKNKLYGTHKADLSEIDARWTASLKEQVGFVPLTVSSDIGTAKIKVSELLNLKAGDIIQLNSKVREPVEVEIEGIPKLTAKPGLMDNNYALKIIAALGNK